MPRATTPNIEDQIYTRIWTVLNQSTDWVDRIPLGHQIRYDLVEGNEDPTSDIPGDADFDRAILKCVSGGNDLFTTTETFGTYAAGVTMPQQVWTETQKYKFQLKLISKLLREVDDSRLRALTVNALRAAGPRMGLSFVISLKVRWETTFSRSTEDNEIDGDRGRFVTNLDIIIEAQADGQTILANQV